jgi:hypothetical protein
MDSIKTSTRILHGFFGDSIGNSMGIPQRVHRGFHGDSTRIPKGNSIGNL